MPSRLLYVWCEDIHQRWILQYSWWRRDVRRACADTWHTASCNCQGLVMWSFCTHSPSRASKTYLHNAFRITYIHTTVINSGRAHTTQHRTHCGLWLWLQSWLMPQSPHCLRNDLKCVEWHVKPCSIQSNSVLTTSHPDYCLRARCTEQSKECFIVCVCVCVLTCVWVCPCKNWTNFQIEIDETCCEALEVLWFWWHMTTTFDLESYFYFFIKYENWKLPLTWKRLVRFRCNFMC